MEYWILAIPILQVQRYENLIASAPIVVFDGNITTDTMGTILDLCRKYNKPGECFLFSFIPKIFLKIYFIKWTEYFIKLSLSLCNFEIMGMLVKCCTEYDSSVRLAFYIYNAWIVIGRFDYYYKL